MEIINTTFVPAGFNTAFVIIGIISSIVSLFILIIGIGLLIEKDNSSFIVLFYGLFFIVLSVCLIFKGRVKESYYKYDVLFTNEKIDMSEFSQKYTITGHDGNIWHIEDVH